jgi:hypothetical protein
MAIPAIIHILGEDAIRADLDAVPDPTHQYLFLRNVRKKDNKPLPYVDDDAEVILFAWHKVTFVEIMQDVQMPHAGHALPGTVGSVNGASQKPAAGTAVLGFFRDDES